LCSRPFSYWFCPIPPRPSRLYSAPSSSGSSGESRSYARGRPSGFQQSLGTGWSRGMTSGRSRAPRSKWGCRTRAPWSLPRTAGFCSPSWSSISEPEPVIPLSPRGRQGGRYRRAGRPHTGAHPAIQLRHLDSDRCRGGEGYDMWVFTDGGATTIAVEPESGLNEEISAAPGGSDGWGREGRPLCSFPRSFSPGARWPPRTAPYLRGRELSRTRSWRSTPRSAKAGSYCVRPALAPSIFLGSSVFGELSALPENKGGPSCAQSAPPVTVSPRLHAMDSR